MKKWRQMTGVFLSLALLVLCVPGIKSQAGYTRVDAPEAYTENSVSTQKESVDAESGGSEGEGARSAAPGVPAGTPIPKIRLSVGNQSTPQYQAGQSVEKLTIQMVNDGTETAKNIRITPAFDQAADWPFEIADTNYERKIDEIAAGDAGSVVWENLKVREDVETKAYKLQFHLTYDDGTYYYEGDRNIYVKTTAKKVEEPVKDPGEKPSEPIVDSGVISDGGIFNGDVSAVGGDASGNKSVPRVIVTGFGTEPGVVNAGSNFRLIVHVKNTSTATAVSNMLFDFQAPSSGTEAAAEAPAFLPSSGSSTVYLDRIPAGETRDIAIDLNARADLVQKPYSINMSMVYEDGNASQFEGSSSLAIPVQQAARFEFSDIEISPASIQVGEEANLMCSLYNTGRVKLYNVKVQFMGDGITSKDVFVGNVESGATGTIDGMLTGESEMAPGSKCKMIVTYEDESGKVSSSEKEFEMEVLPAMEMDMSMMEELPQEEKGFPFLPVVILLMVIVVAVVVVILLRRRKKKRALAEEEDLADEVDRFTEDE